MANPTRGDFRSLKKVAKFLVGRVAEVWRFVWQEEEEEGQSVLVYNAAANFHIVANAEWL